MSVHAYPSRTLWGDDLRALIGTVACLALLAVLPLAPPVMAVVAALALLFVVFGLCTVQRHRTRIAMSETGLRALGPRGTEIPWAALDAMKLSYYAVRRDRTRRDGAGWMQLVLRAGRARLSLDSRIEGFVLVVARAANAAAARHLALAPTTRANLQALGIPLPEPLATPSRVAGERA